MLKQTLPTPCKSTVPTSVTPRAKVLAAGLRAFGCLLALGWQVGCGGGPIEFDLTQVITEQRIKAGSGTLPTLLPIPVVIGFDAKQQAVMRNANGPVSTVNFTALSFETTMGGTTAGSMAPFDFVQSVEVYIESTRANSSLAREKIATLLTPPGRVIGFNLTPNPTVNLLPFLQEGAHLVSTASGRLPAADVTFTGSFSVHVRTL